MARQKRFSDRVYNQRRRMQRALPRLQRELDNTTDQFRRRALEADIDRTKRIISELRYNPKDRSSKPVTEEQLKKIETRNKSITKRSLTYSFREEIRKASRGEESALAERRNSKLYAKAFFVATAPIWERHPGRDRLEVIEEYARSKGFKNLEEYYNALMNDPEARKVMDKYVAEATSGYNVADTDEVLDAYETVVEPEDGTPTEFSRMQYIAMTIAGI